MAQTHTKSFGAGIRESWIALGSNDRNLILGNSATIPTPGATGNPGIHLKGIQSAGGVVPEAEAVDIPGDDGNIGEILFDSQTGSEMVISLSVQDLDTESLMDGTAVATFGNIALKPLRIKSPDFGNAVIVLNSQAVKQDSGQAGSPSWTSRILPRVVAQPLDVENFQNQSPLLFRYKTSVNFATHTPWGLTITEATWSTTSTNGFKATCNYPLAPHRFTGDGSTVTFTGLLRTPSTNSDDSIVAVQGAALATNLYTFNAANKSITFSSAPGLGFPIALFYGYTEGS